MKNKQANNKRQKEKESTMNLLRKKTAKTTETPKSDDNIYD